ncbi:MAG: dockerin type I repeat-containing protein [Ruminococcus sp.]|nr:dockerin type I repeat-containing protein [Ruminococcus sp.]
MKRMKKLIAAASAAVMLASASIVPVSAANSVTYRRGDVDNNGVVNIHDYVSLLTYYYGYDVPGVNKKSADINKDGKVDLKDIDSIKKQIVNEIQFTKNSDGTYTLVYKKDTFTVYYKESKKTDGSTDEDWKIMDSWRIDNYEIMRIICQILMEEHPIHYPNSSKVRSVDSMAIEWVLHNSGYIDYTEKGDTENAERCRHVDINSNDADRYNFFN